MSDWSKDIKLMLPEYEDLINLIGTNIELLDKTHNWLWSNTDHSQFRSQSAKYNALKTYNDNLLGIIGILMFLRRFNNNDDILEILTNNNSELPKLLLDNVNELYKQELELIALKQ